MAVDTKPKPRKPEPTKIVHGTGENTNPWWTEVTPHSALDTHVKSLEKDQQERYDRFLEYFRFYGGRDMLNFSPRAFVAPPLKVDGERVKMNVIRAVCDTSAARISKNKPYPQFLTEQGRFDERRRAKKLTRYVRGVFHANDAWGIGQKAFRTAQIVGTGTAKVFSEGGQVKIEYTFALENLVDDTEAFHGKPRTRYQVKAVPRDTLLARHPKHQQEIKDAQAIPDDGGQRFKGVEHLRVSEAWRLPSAPGKDDGRHVIAVETATLEDEPWTRTRFPLVDFHWANPLVGFWGGGVVETLEGLQIEINRYLINIQKAHKLVSKPWVFLQKGSGITPSQISNAFETYTYTGAKPPEVQVFQTVHQEIYQQLDRYFQRAFELAGVSMLSATSQKPAGLESGAAFREYNDIESERFILVGQQYEKFFMDLARLVVDEARAMAEAGQTVSTRDAGRRDMRTIDWKKAALDEQQYIMQVFPVSSLPNTPAGRKQQVMEYVQAGWISKEQAMRLMDMPDLAAEENLLLAAIEDIDAMIEKMLDGEKVGPPDPMQNLQLGLERVRAAYLVAKVDGAPEEILDTMRAWWNAAVDTLKPAPMPGETVPDAPAATPQSPVPAAPPDAGAPTEPPPLMS